MAKQFFIQYESDRYAYGVWNPATQEYGYYNIRNHDQIWVEWLPLLRERKQNNENYKTI